jgi:hypothetical protein
MLAYRNDGFHRWLRCVNCGSALAENNGTLSPSAKPLRVPIGVTGVELDVWEEVRECLAVGAFTAAVMMCRKLLFHVAVSQGLAAKNEKDFAPTYTQAVEFLEDEGLVTKKMRTWVDRIKDVGNDANHEITPITQGAAMDVAEFTEQLLRLTYEMDALIEAGNQRETDALPLADAAPGLTI